MLNERSQLKTPHAYVCIICLFKILENLYSNRKLICGCLQKGSQKDGGCGGKGDLIINVFWDGVYFFEMGSQ